MNPIELFKWRILIKKPKNLIEKRFQLAQNSKENIQQLDSKQKASLKISLEKEIHKWKNCFKWKEWSPNSRGPLFESDKFALPKPIPGIEEPKWVISIREFLKSLPEIEKKTLF